MSGRGPVTGTGAAAEPPTHLHFTYDGCMALQCFAGHPGDEFGEHVAFVDPGDSLDALLAKVAKHRTEHGCASDNPQVTT